MSEQKMSTEEKAEIWADMIGDDFLYMAKQFREILDEAPEAFRNGCEVHRRRPQEGLRLGAN